MDHTLVIIAIFSSLRFIAIMAHMLAIPVIIITQIQLEVIVLITLIPVMEVM